MKRRKNLCLMLILNHQMLHWCMAWVIMQFNLTISPDQWMTLSHQQTLEEGLTKGILRMEISKRQQLKKIDLKSNKDWSGRSGKKTTLSISLFISRSGSILTMAWLIGLIITSITKRTDRINNGRDLVIYTAKNNLHYKYYRHYYTIILENILLYII